MDSNPQLPNVLLAPGALKNSLRAWQAAEALKRGLVRSGWSANYHLYPLADGGDGTVQVLTRCLGGVFRSAKVQDPLGRIVSAHYGWIGDRKLAICEMAEASGLHRLAPEEYNPMEASSFGTGQLLLAAKAQGAEEIWLGVGGSATVDGGLGALAALGIRCTDASGAPIASGGQGLQEIAHIEAPNPQPLEGIKLRILTDVGITLTGPNGAAAIFGPQKGATATMVKELDQGLEHLAALWQRDFDQSVLGWPGGGAAGGIAVALRVVCNAQWERGAEFVMEQTGLLNILPQAHFVFTAEGQLDRSTLVGKAPGLLARKALGLGIPCYGLAGAVEDREELETFFTAIFPINPVWEGEATYRMAGDHLAWAADQVGRVLRNV